MRNKTILKIVAALVMMGTLASVVNLSAVGDIALLNISSEPSPRYNPFLASSDSTSWNRTYGGVNDEEGNSVVQTCDGGYIAVGRTYSFGAGGGDFWVIKTDASGNLQWNKTYGGSDVDQALCVVPANDGGYAVAGPTMSFGAGDSDIWLIKIDSNGNMQWNKTYGGAGRDVTHSLIRTSDGGYAMGGYTYSFGAGPSNFWLIKVDSSGSMQWNKTYGGPSLDEALTVIQTLDGGYAIAGYTWSFGAGASDTWLVKTDSSGNMQWNKTYGSATAESAWFIIQTSDEGYALVGERGFGSDFWFVKTDSNGNMEWSNTYGGPFADWATAVVQTGDGGYMVAGWTYSFGAGDRDFWLVKTDADGNMQRNKAYGGTNDDYVVSMQRTGHGGYLAVGLTNSFGVGGFDLWLLKLGLRGDVNGDDIVDIFDIAQVALDFGNTLP